VTGTAPEQVIARKRQARPDLLLVAEKHGEIVGTAMAGYDGHRGWVYHVAVAPAARRQGIGAALMAEVERRLAALGCPKVKIQVHTANPGAILFYRALGYGDDGVVSMGKTLR
jgi:ribosomal protein S18 acetylase RimI-like enzyme